MVHLSIRRSSLSARMVLLAFAFVSGVLFSGCKDAQGDFAKKKQAQETMAAALTNLGAKVARANNGLSQNWAVDLSQVRFTSQIADQLKELGASVDVLDLSKTSIDDSQLADLIDHQALNGVVELNLSHNAAITDQSLDKLARLWLLQDLNLVGTQVTEAGIARFRERRQAMTSKMDEVTSVAITKATKKEFKIRH